MRVISRVIRHVLQIAGWSQAQVKESNVFSTILSKKSVIRESMWKAVTQA